MLTLELVEKVSEYVDKGYSFALDDMVLSKEYYDTFKTLFRLVEVIKVDYMFCDKAAPGLSIWNSLKR